MMQDDFSVSRLALTAGLLLLAYAFLSLIVLPRISPHTRFLDSHPWVGVKKQWFPRLRAGFAAIENTQGMMIEGSQYTQRGKPFVLPQFASEPLVILPADTLREVFNSGQIDAHVMHVESISEAYTIGTGFGEGPHMDIVRRQLTRKLSNMTNDVYEELVRALHDQWPRANDNKFVRVKAYDSCMKIVSRAANRVFCGSDLCRNPEFLEVSRLYSQSVFKIGAVLNLFPGWLKPIVAPILTRDISKYRDLCSRIVTPEIHNRLKHLQSETKEDPAYVEPYDVLQWLLIDSIKRASGVSLDNDVIVRQILVLNMVAIHTTSIAITHTLLDIYSSPNFETIVTGLREECERVMAEFGGVWTKDAVNKLVRVDSTIRETMRFGAQGDLSLKRLVTAKGGITLSNGIHLPSSTRISWSAYDIHQDQKKYPERPHEYDAFRFSRPREEYLERVRTGTVPKGSQKEFLEQKNTGLIAVSNDWLSFGHPTYACPGRFFAAQEMKLMLAHIVMNYDIKIEGGRPANWLVSGNSLPSESAELLVRARS